MTLPISAAFNKTIDYYDTWIRKAVPGYDDMCHIARQLLPDSVENVAVLDLGAGTGLFSELVMESCPAAHFTLWDIADKMLEVAKERFKETSANVAYVVDDYRTLCERDSFHLVISSLSIHHLADPEKQELFIAIYNALKPGGIFINIDQIRGPSLELQELYCRKWEELTRDNGATEEEVQGGLERRRLYDREATMEHQLQWLCEAGFVDVDCIYKNWLMGLFYARKAALPCV
jgi:tRNA (cmo5U34)-methyltransferase